MNFIALLILFVLVQSCNNNRQTELNNYRNEKIDSTFIRFGLPYSDLTIDSNSLIFYSMRNFDTSFLVHFKKQDTGISGVYYEVLPTYHRNQKDYRSQESKLLFFEGFTFRIDTIKWQAIKRKLTFNLLQQDSSLAIKSCTDCPKFLLAYNYKTVHSDYKNRKNLEEFAKFLKDSCLNLFLAQRHPILHK